MARKKPKPTKLKAMASRSQPKSGCSACKERRLNGDETLPTCPQCQDDERECKGMSERISASSETLPPSNTSPVAKIRAIAVNAESLPSPAETPPSDVSAPDNRTIIDLTCAKGPFSNNGEAEPGASQACNGLGVQEEPVITEGEWLGDQEKRLQESQNVGPVARRTDSHQALALGGLEQAEQLTGCEGLEDSKKRTAGVLSPATIDRSKRARGDNGRKIQQCITVSFGPAGDHVETASDCEPPSASETCRPTSPADSPEIQSKNDCDAVQKPQMALSIQPSHSPKHTSRVQSLRVVESSPHPHQGLSSTTEGFGALEERGNTAESSASRNHQCDPASPTSIPPSSAQERVNAHVPSNARQSTASVPIETEQDPGRSWNAQRTDNHSQSASARSRRPRPLLPRTITPTMQRSQATSAESLRPTHYQGTCNNGSASSLEAMASLNNSSQVPPHLQARYQPIIGGRGSLVNRDHRQSFANTADASPIILPQQLQIHQPPPVRFTRDTRIEGTLSRDAMEPYFEFFSNHSQIIMSQKTGRVKRLPIGAIMWQSASTLNPWYMNETGTNNISSLRFQLVSGDSKLDKILIVYNGDANAFQMLKQIVWDYFWARLSSYDAAAIFQVLISALPPSRDDFLRGPVGAAVCEMKPVDAPRYFPTTKFEDVSMVDSRSVMGLTGYHPEQRQSGEAPQLRDPNSQMSPLPGPEIIFRLQMNRMGEFSKRYHRSFLKTRSTREFFTWFVSQTGRSGDDTPSALTFTFKDAMPAPISSTIEQGNERFFSLMMRDIQTQCDKANNLASGLKEFAIFVTDPKWVVEEDPW